MRTQTGDASGTLDTGGPGTGQAEKAALIYADQATRLGVPPRSALERVDVPLPPVEMLAVSTFSGVGGLDYGLQLGGVHSVLMAENDEWCRGVLAHRFPRATILEDVRDVTSATIAAALARYHEEQHDGASEADEGARAGGGGGLGGDRGDGHPFGARRGPPGIDPGGGAPLPPSGGDGASAGAHDQHGQVLGGALEHRPSGDRHRGVDLLHGGFPCQDVSVAGKRAGLAGDRTGLFFEYARIADAVRPAWLLLENVPGLLTSNGGRDFGVVLDTLAELGYGLAWRVLDSRYFGVPQRRRRVFLVGRLGGDGPGALRALCESCSGSATASACTWQEAPLRARAGAQEDGGRDPSYWIEDSENGTLRAGGHGGAPPRSDRNPLLVTAPELSVTLSAGSHPNSAIPGRQQADDYNLVVPDVSATLQAKRGKGGGGIGPEESLIAGALTSTIGDLDDQDATRLVAPTMRSHQRSSEPAAYVLQPDDAGVAPGALRGRRVDASPALGTNTPVTDRGLRVIGDLEHREGDVARPFYVKGNGEGYQTDVPNALATGGGQPGQGYAAARTASGVRRLTPVECERLQGFPDGWTVVPGQKCPDGRRYAAMGNAVTVNVAEWLARRVIAEHRSSGTLAE